MDRRSFVIGSAAAAAAFRPSFAQDTYPSRAITVINPFPPGGAVDVVMRPLAAILEPMVQKPVVIDTKAGAAGQVGAQVAAHAKPDGYTLLSHLTSISGFAEVDRLFGRQPKFTNADFIPLARYVADPCVLVCNDQQPYKSLQEFVDDAKKRPNEIIFSSSGLYGALHIPTALFTAAAGVKLRHLPTQGGGPALTALLGNNSQVLVSSVSACLSQIKAGKARPLALFGGERSKALPDVPTMKASGYDVEYYLWVGTFAPKGTPANVITYLREVLSKAASSEQFKVALANLGQEPAYMDQPEFAACHERRLVIEVDGGQHNEMSRATADDRRTEFLHAHGYRMLRFWNNEVLGNIDGVMQIICAALRAPPPLTPPHRAMRGGRGTERS